MPGALSKRVRTLRCHYRGCGLIPHRPAMGLYCSPKCEKAEIEEQAADADVLTKVGFTQSKDDKGVFAKDGVMLTLGAVKHHGIEKALALHSAAGAAKK